MKEKCKDCIAKFAANSAIGVYFFLMFWAVVFDDLWILTTMAWFSFGLAIVYSDYFQKFLRTHCCMRSRWRRITLIFVLVLLSIALFRIEKFILPETWMPRLNNFLTWLAILLTLKDKGDIWP